MGPARRNDQPRNVSRELFDEFDAFLVKRQLSFEGIVIGGAALILLDVVSRTTRDCDVLDPNIPAEVKDASVEFAAFSSKRGKGLDPDWLNNGPASLIGQLPQGWRSRLRLAYRGKALLLRSLSRGDLLKTKLFGYCDRGVDEDDCLALEATHAELDEALLWVQEQDANPAWPAHVQSMFETHKKKLAK